MFYSQLAMILPAKNGFSKKGTLEVSVECGSQFQSGKLHNNDAEIKIRG